MKRVLLVDDDRYIADSLASLLRSSGYQAIAVYDGQSALEECESAAPDLIISDVMMPGMTGIEMAVQIKQRHASCKILLSSRLADAADLLQAARLRGYDFELLPKPIRLAELLSRMAV